MPMNSKEEQQTRNANERASGRTTEQRTNNHMSKRIAQDENTNLGLKMTQVEINLT